MIIAITKEDQARMDLFRKHTALNKKLVKLFKMHTTVGENIIEEGGTCIEDDYEKILFELDDLKSAIESAKIDSLKLHKL